MKDEFNPSEFSLHFAAPYWDTSEMEDGDVTLLLNELQRELQPGHQLKDRSMTLLARRLDNDDVILLLDTGEVAVVHMTWSAKQKVEGFPLTRIYRDKKAFWDEEMKNEIEGNS